VRESSHGRCDRSASTGRRLCAGLIDFLPLFGLAALVPPTFAWTIGSAYLLFRDAGRSPLSLGKRVLGLRVESLSGHPLSYVDSFSRNLPLLVPYVGPLVEAALIARGGRRLGDRLAGARVTIARIGT
jgi:uncharacterized RDD family membrane protein YckC